MDDAKLFLMLGELTAKVDQVLEMQKENTVEITAIGKRITALETFKTKATATVAAVAATAGGSLGIALKEMLMP